MLGTVFHYAVVEPEDDHARCEIQKDRVIAMHENMGYRKGGAYNGHFCQHGYWWISYLGPNQATGNTWANLNLHAWCYLATVGTPVTDGAADAAHTLTLVEPTGRDQIYPHSAFFPTSCCGDPLREWIANGALPSGPPDPEPLIMEGHMRLFHDIDADTWAFWTGINWQENIDEAQRSALIFAGVPHGEIRGPALNNLREVVGQHVESLVARIRA